MNTLSQFGTWMLFLGLPLLFLAIVAWIYRPGAGRRYRADGRIPFGEENKSATHGPTGGNAT